MRGTHIVVTCWFFVEFCVVSAENTPTFPNDEGAQESKDTEEIQIQRDHHIFVALIDVVFTDYSKQICTGTIIHEYVVITTAHCFVQENSSPELTMSFVVIGTKKMFAVGYEHYLPIERYKIHPKFNGWKADLVLVYTFAAMTSDKPGKALKLAVDKVNNPMESPVTVLSWGQCGDGQNCNKSKQNSKKENKQESKKESKQESQQENNQESKPHKKESMYHPTISYDRSEEDTPLRKHGNRKMRSENNTESPSESGTTNHDSPSFIDLQKQSVDQTFNIQFEAMVTEESHHDTEVKSYFSNWRRKMGPQQNNLTVQTFGFVDIQACKKVVDQAMSEPHDIMDGNDFVCYSSHTHFLNDDDAGAPVVRQGRLYAVTITGVESNDEHVAIGLRMVCYCSWIAENLPSGGSGLNCCKDCCDLGNRLKEPEQTKSQNKRYANRYVRVV